MILALLLAGCRPPVGDADDACAAEWGTDEAEADVRTVGTLLPEGADGGLHVVARWPDRTPREGDRWPVAVVIQGGWGAAGTPVDGENAHVEAHEGVVGVHVDLPGGGLSGGEDDRRGPAARAAVAAALRWAAGELRDAGGCTLADRTLAGDPDDLYLVGLSNGGNLAAATLADVSLDLPPVSGLVTWETPAGAPFVTVELGNDPTVYTAGSCRLGEDGAILCPIPEELLAVEPGDPDLVCFDLDGDAACGDADVVVKGVEDPVSDLAMVGPELREALDARGLVPEGYADAETARAWWAERDAARLADAVVAAWPTLPVLLLGTEEDHVLTEFEDSPHVFGLGEALQTAGAAWTRLNPGDRWLDAEGPTNEPNAPMRLEDPDLALLTEDDESPLGGLLAAAVRELSERNEKNDW